MTVRILHDRHVVLGVTGSIAAYKALDLASRLVQAGAQVHAAMTPAATRLVSPLSLQALCHRPVATDMFDPRGELGIDHVALAKQADILVIAPITANTIAKLASGLADDVVSTTFLATTAPVVVAPAMESHMWQHPATQRNLELLRSWGIVVVEPERGHLASGAEGVGRLAEPAEIVGAIRKTLGQNGPLARNHVVVTAGPTQEDIDPVRYISNHSSGRMGYAIAEAVRDLGARVTLIAGPTALTAPVGVELREVVSTRDMRDAVLDTLSTADALISAAAVADYRPGEPSKSKIKKTPAPPSPAEPGEGGAGRGEGILTLELTQNPDILQEVAAWKAQRGRTRPVTIGFAAETDNLVVNADAKRRSKSMDLIVANPVPASFGGAAVEATLIGTDGRPQHLPPQSKQSLANSIADRLVDLLASTANVDQV